MLVFKIYPKGRHWVMQLDMEPLPETMIMGGMLYKWSQGDILVLDEELRDRPGVKRMSYDQWYWTSHHDLNRFLTFWHLKYGHQ